MTVDWQDDKYIGIFLNSNYSKRELRTSIPGYVKSSKTVKPYTFIPRYITANNTKRKLQLQRIVGKFLYFARATDETITQRLNQLSTKSEGSKKNTN